MTFIEFFVHLLYLKNMVDNKLLPKLSQNLLEILNDEEYYDITIEVGKDPNVKTFRAHMMLPISIFTTSFSFK